MATRNISTRNTAERLAGLLNTYYAKKTYVDEKVAAAISSAYKPGGTKAAADLTSALLVKANEGLVYNISDKLTITDANKDLFVEGAKSSYPAGTNVVVINTGTAEAPAYKYDVLAGFVDLSNYVEKVSGTAGNIAKLTDDGSYEDTGIAANSVQQKLTTGAFTENNIRVTDANGFAKDGGIAKDDIVVASDISDYTEAELKALLGIPTE